MKHNPIQIILNTKNYISREEPPPGGGKTDFYQDRDADYITHKNALLRQVENVASLLRVSANPFTTVKVELNQAALAKSHRPLQCLFKSDKSPMVGAIGLGNLLFQANLSSLSWLHDKISESEELTNWVQGKNKVLKAKPSIAKSETGAVEKISHYGPEDKQSFPVEDALAWFSHGHSFKGYIVETINYVENKSRGYELTADVIRRAKSDLEKNLRLLGAGFVLSKIGKTAEDTNYLYIRLLSPETQTFYVNFDTSFPGERIPQSSFDFNAARHALLLKILRDSPLVKSISLPPELAKSEFAAGEFHGDIALPIKTPDALYPKVGLIDAGIRDDYLKQWCSTISDGFSPEDCDPNHASQVASLMVAGKAMNPNIPGLDDDGCLIYDIWLPIHSEKDDFFSHFDSLGEFFDWLDYEVKIAVEAGIKIFNLSVNFREYVRDEKYSFSASRIDAISLKYDVIFVISAGNLRPIDHRTPWPGSLSFPSDIDRLSQPSEAITAITVGALNPHGCDRNVYGAPTVYTRRGPGVAMGVKPDVAHYGGFAQRGSAPTGLVCLNGSGVFTQECGTSFSAPLVSKILSSLDFRTKEILNRNTLVSILIHHSNFTPALKDKRATSLIRRRFAGFGRPSSSVESLVTDDHAITIVFEANIKKKEVVLFDFAWPNSLIKNGKCRGDVTLTLVYDGVVNPDFGGEYCRVNVDAILQQETKVKDEWLYRKRCNSIWEDRVGKEKTFEKNQIEHGLKWWPIKKYHKYSKNGIGVSKSWRLKIESMERSSGCFPSEGINICAIITIQDIDKKSPNLFNEVRQHLASVGVEIKPVDVAQDVIIKMEA